MKTSSLLPALLLAATALPGGFALAGLPELPHVSIEATVPVTTEPAPNIRVIPGEFTIRRRGGDMASSLTVWLSSRGTATPDADYAALPDRVEFAPRQDTLTLKVMAVDDDEVEEAETVIAALHDPTLGPRPLFEIDPNRARATVTINDSDRKSDGTVVSIEATRRIAEETAAPLRRLNLVGEFTISRSEPGREALPVYVHVSGSATPRIDFEPIPLLARIPAGEKSVSFPVTAVFDQVPEGIETVIATVSNCPPEGMLAPCYDFRVDESRQSDTVFIREDGLTVATVHLTAPSSGDQFPLGEPIRLRATAIHLESYLSRVEFWAGESQIGESEIFFVRAPDPGTPIHHEFVWQRAPASVHVLTARAELSDPNRAGKETIVSSPVRISVGGGTGGNKPPEASIVSPAPRDQFPVGEPIQIVVQGLDPDGYIPQVELFADRLKIGELNINFFVEPPPGELQTFTFAWEHPMPGPHVLTARLTDNDGDAGHSPPVEILVNGAAGRPIVNVMARDALAVEPGANERPNHAIFRISRLGPDGDDLPVRYELAGRAENGVDYERLSGNALIPAGSASVDITVVPLPDREPEESESVEFLLLEDPAYLVEHPRRAYAVIRDQPLPVTPAPPRCLRLPDGLIHLCFPAPPVPCVRLEGSSDLRNWKTILCLPVVDGNVHFVDETVPGLRRRFFRIAEEPNAPRE